MTEETTNANTVSPARDEWKVLFVLAISLLLMEGLVRCFAGSLSIDLRNTIATPQTSERIARAPGNVRTILVVGNSLARRGVDTALLGGGEHPAEVEVFAPDGSSVAQWDWGVKRYFANAGAHPDMILVMTGRTHLLDIPASPETLGAYFVGAQDLGAALRSMPDGESSLRLLLGAGSHLLANRDRVRTRIGYSFMPGFETAWPELTAGKEPGQPDGREQAVGTESLRRLVSTARSMGSDLRVFSVPLPEPYRLPQPVLGFLSETGTPYADLSVVPGITPEHFPDGYHLDEDGAKIFTRAILDSLRRQSTGEKLSGDAPHDR
ncbi:hypothetical protein HZ994_06540 [Akkermansiaceae bacterium]|nr:hypothetical protein HZ994_06540 [Akkermansiaceae bacterium]